MDRRIIIEKKRGSADDLSVCLSEKPGVETLSDLFAKIIRRAALDRIKLFRTVFRAKFADKIHAKLQDPIDLICFGDSKDTIHFGTSVTYLFSIRLFPQK